VQDLLYGLMLRSGNDCAMALSLYCSASVEDFAIKMNETAQKAGALQTQFKNPHGLPCKGHYTTARDLSLMTCYAMQNTTFREIVSTQYYERRHWKNKNKLLFEYDECIGVKTGYTKEAGRCLVSAGKRDGMTIICSVLNCADMYKRSETLLKEAFSAYSYVKIIDKSQSFSIADSKQKGKVAENVYYPLLPEERELIELKIVASTVKNKDSHGEIIGQIQIYLAKQLLFSQNLYKL
jgi:D-alanyl-D-alanine carboxypeptidase